MRVQSMQRRPVGEQLGGASVVVKGLRLHLGGVMLVEPPRPSHASQRRPRHRDSQSAAWCLVSTHGNGKPIP
eukprot:5329794-Pyramimonas_sp.AAC.1